MTNLSVQRRLAAKILGVGKDRIAFDPDRSEDIEDAITREDVKKLYREGAIKVKPVAGISSGRRRSRRRGPGRKKGHRVSGKESWMIQVRALRRLLKGLKAKGDLDNRTYRELYMKVKGGAIRTRRRLLEIVEARRGAQG